MELYTSLTRLKMTMNGGEMPPMTELNARARGLLDISFTEGMGALQEHPEWGLRCPIRGCGKYFHHLSTHLSAAHRNMGGAPALRALLDIPRSVPLMTVRARQLMREHCYEKNDALHQAARRDRGPRTQAAHQAKINGKDVRRSIHYQNLHDRCHAQLSTKVKALYAKLGRLPRRCDFTREYGYALWRYTHKLYGPWVQFIRAMGYPGYRHRGWAA